MNNKEREQIEEMYIEHGYKCFVCGKPATQRAHIIGNTKANRKACGDEVIDNPLNWLPACSLYCNGLIDSSNIRNIIALNIFNNDMKNIHKIIKVFIEKKKSKLKR